MTSSARFWQRTLTRPGSATPATELNEPFILESAHARLPAACEDRAGSRNPSCQNSRSIAGGPQIFAPIARYARSSWVLWPGSVIPGHSKIDNYDETKLAKASRYGRCPGFFLCRECGPSARDHRFRLQYSKAVPLRQLCLSCLPRRMQQLSPADAWMSQLKKQRRALEKHRASRVHPIVQRERRLARCFSRARRCFSAGSSMHRRGDNCCILRR